MKNIVSVQPDNISFELFKSIRTNLDFLLKDKENIVLFTSASKGDGKSFVVSNLAASFTQLNKKVLIIDLDLRRGTQHKNLEVNLTNGMTDLLMDENATEISKYIKKTKIKNLYVMTRGKVQINTPEILLSGKLEAILKVLKGSFDYVFVDAPPVNIVTDVTILNKIVKNTILITSLNQTKIDLIEKAKRDLINNDANLLGVIANRVPIHKYRYKYKGYDYEYDEGSKKNRKK